MANQPANPQSTIGKASEFLILHQTFARWNIEKINAPQAIFSAHIYVHSTNILVFSVYATPSDHPPIGTQEDWQQVCNAASRAGKQPLADFVAVGLWCADPTTERINGVVFEVIETLSKITPTPRTENPAYVNWTVDKLHWLWQQAFGNRPFPAMRISVRDWMHFEEQCCAEFPGKQSDEWMALLFDKSPEKRRQGLNYFQHTDDREWLQTIIRMTTRESDPHVFDILFEVIAHFNAQHELAVYTIKWLSDDHDMSDRFSRDKQIEQDRYVLRRLGDSVVPEMLQSIESVNGLCALDLLGFLVATNDQRVKPALQELLKKQTLNSWKREKILSALNQLGA